MEGGAGHLLSLKVMRVSRPALAHAWQPFYSSSPSFSAHSTASILSLQGNTPLPDHPKTLRDLTHASEMLTLPSSFGAIQLGETFSSCLAVNNEAQVDIDGVVLKIEIQTATTKVLLVELGGQDFRLAAGDTLETVVHHEIKELGQHVLACTVSYQLPVNARNVPNPLEESSLAQTFRKFYKFGVTNPLSVKTKVHVPRSPSALMSLTERDKVFLEVHIQNLTHDSIWFERMRFDCADGWAVKDDNDVALPGSMTVLQPQDMRQYIYILNPISVSIEPVIHAPGSVLSLGRLDLSWRSSLGEPGRLLTSMLSRRIPLPPPVQSASAIPTYLKKGFSSAGPPRPHSPQLIHSRPTSPVRSGSPTPSLPNRASTILSPRPQSPAPAPAHAQQPTDLDVHIVVREPPSDVVLRKAFPVAFTLSVSAASFPTMISNRRRIVTLAVQHVQPAPAHLAPLALGIATADASSPKVLSSPGYSTPTHSVRTFNYVLAHQKLLAASPRAENDRSLDNDSSVVVLPPPVLEPGQREGGKLPDPSVIAFHGSSAIFLPAVELLKTSEDDEAKLSATQDFELTWFPMKSGFTGVGGLRVMLVEDKILDGDDDVSEERDRGRRVASILKHWDVVAEVWVSS